MDIIDSEPAVPHDEEELDLDAESGSSSDCFVESEYDTISVVSVITSVGRVSPCEKHQPTKQPSKPTKHVRAFHVLILCLITSFSVTMLVRLRKSWKANENSDKNGGHRPTPAPSPFGLGSDPIPYTQVPSASPMHQVSDAPTPFKINADAFTAPPSATDVCAKKYPPPPPLPGKKGAALVFRDEGLINSWVVNLPKVLLLNPYWNYNWGATRIAAQPDDIEFVPMIWGGRNLTSVQEQLQAQVVPLFESGKVKRIFGFNEPDATLQSNIPVQRALDMWPALESMNLPLTSPSCAHPQNAWMQDFMENATATCKRVDWVGIHWYGGANFATFVNNITSYHDLYGQPIVITEFASADWSATTVAGNKLSRAAVLAFMKKALPWLEAQDWIVGYAWFSFDTTDPSGTSSALFDEQGGLTVLGQFYSSVRNGNPQGNQSITFSG